MLITLGFLTPTTMAILLIIALVIFGPGKLPELGKALGRGINEFKTASEEQVVKGNLIKDKADTGEA